MARLGAAVAERPVGAELGEVEQQLLGRARQVEDLVEQQHTAAGELDQPLARGQRAGEGARQVAEQLRRDRVEVVALPQGRAHERRASAGVGDRAGQERLAGARLARDEDRLIAVQGRRELGAESDTGGGRRSREGRSGGKPDAQPRGPVLEGQAQILALLSTTAMRRAPMSRTDGGRRDAARTRGSRYRPRRERRQRDLPSQERSRAMRR